MIIISHEKLDKAMEFYYILNQTEFYFIFIPFETYDIIDFFKIPGIGNRYHITSFNIDLFPLDNDLISAEKDGSFRQIYVDNDITSIAELAESFLKLELCFGKIKHKYIKGDRAKLFCDLVEKKEQETNLKTTDEILGMIVFDRNVDFLTPFSSNYTFEGLLDEHFGINKGCIIIENSYLNVNENAKGKKEDNRKALYNLASNNANLLQNEIRCMNYLDANRYMNDLQNYYLNQKKEDSKDLKKLQSDIATFQYFIKYYKNPMIINRRFITKFIDENHKEDNMIYRAKEGIFLSGALPSNLKLFYDDYINEKKDFFKLINLFILESLTQGYIRDFATFKRDILNIYGYQNILLLRDLEKIGLINEKPPLIKIPTQTFYQQIRDKLNLISPYADNIKSRYQDCSYIYQGYCPIILRLIERAIEGKWGKNKDIISKIPGETIFPEDESEIIKPPSEKKVHTIFVVFVGGVSYNEIEGIRFINRNLKLMYDKNKEKNPNSTRIQLIIVTNEILNKNKIFKSLGQDFSGSNYTFKKLHDDIEKEKKEKEKLKGKK